VAVDPGPHRIAADDDGTDMAVFDVNAVPGQKQVVRLGQEKARGAAPPDRLPRPRWRVAAGAAAVGVGVGIAAFGVSALAVNGQCHDPAPGVACTQVFDTGAKGTGLLVAGAALLVAGAVTWAWPGEEQRQMGLAAGLLGPGAGLRLFASY
jgi:hypothetical protein